MCETGLGERRSQVCWIVLIEPVTLRRTPTRALGQIYTVRAISQNFISAAAVYRARFSSLGVGRLFSQIYESMTLTFVPHADRLG